MDNNQQPETHAQARALTLTHPRFGDRTISYSPYQTLSELRSLIEAKCELYLFSNYYF